MRSLNRGVSGLLPRCFLLMATAVPAAFRYADGATTTGGQFNNSAGYAPANVVNNGFTSPTNTIGTTTTYTASGK